jgi:predicted RNA-binding Zn-ribbon protein involved in translation (DUF1610 family)
LVLHHSSGQQNGGDSPVAGPQALVRSAPMKKEKVREVTCDTCGFEIVIIYQREDGLKQLELHGDLTLILKDKNDSQSSTSSLICPHCGKEMSVRLGLFSRYS